MGEGRSGGLPGITTQVEAHGTLGGRPEARPDSLLPGPKDCVPLSTLQGEGQWGPEDLVGQEEVGPTPLAALIKDSIC